MATSMEVGPSAAPMMAMAAALGREKPMSAAKISVRNIPSCAEPPRINSFGLDSRGPKSIMAPMPINSRMGMASLASIPTLNREERIPSSAITAEPGILTSIAPKPMGSSRAGSISFLMARKISVPPMSHMTTCCHSTWEMVSMRKCITYLRNKIKDRHVNIPPKEEFYAAVLSFKMNPNPAT